MSARRHVERALRFIAENLERPLTLHELARAAHLSDFHFHRVFHAEVGESPGHFITRRRLELAALRLAYEPERSVTDIALSSGYSSSSNFTKAFTGYFGCSPTDARTARSAGSELGKLTARYGKNFDPRELYTLAPASDRSVEARRWNERVRFETIDERPLAALSCPDGYDLEAVAETWTRMLALSKQLGLWSDGADAWGAPRDSPHLTAASLIRYDACLPCLAETSLPDPLFHTTMLAGRYAVFSWEGPALQVGDAHRSIYSCWFPQSAYVPEDYEPLDHYVTGFPRDGRVELELWFRVRATT
ncbi:MAG: AraC family transcriptional regulator [Archangium sp.]